MRRDGGGERRSNWRGQRGGGNTSALDAPSSSLSLSFYVRARARVCVRACTYRVAHTSVTNVWPEKLPLVRDARDSGEVSARGRETERERERKTEGSREEPTAGERADRAAVNRNRGRPSASLIDTYSV